MVGDHARRERPRAGLLAVLLVAGIAGGCWRGAWTGAGDPPADTDTDADADTDTDTDSDTDADGDMDSDTDGDTGTGTAPPLANPTLAWAVKAIGWGPATVNELAALSNGGVVLVGDFQGILEVDPLGPNHTNFGGSVNMPSGFVMYFDDDGHYQWGIPVSDYNSAQRVLSVVALPDDSVVVAGGFAGELGGSILPEDTATLASAGQLDGFLARVDAQGEMIWIRQAGGAAWDVVSSVRLLAPDRLLVVGHFAAGPGGGAGAEIVFAAGEPEQTSLVASGDGPVFYATYDLDGTFLEGGEIARGAEILSVAEISTRADGSVALGGTFSDTAQVGTGSAIESFETSGEAAWFLGDFSPELALEWTASGLGAHNVINSLAAGGPGTVAFGASFSGDGSFGVDDPFTVWSGTGQDGALGLFSAEGEAGWLTTFDCGSDDEVAVIRFDLPGRICFAGMVGDADSTCQVVLGEGAENEAAYETLGKGDVVIGCHAADGQLEWARFFGSVGEDRATAMAVGENGTVFVAGNYSQPVVVEEQTVDLWYLDVVDNDVDGAVFLVRYDP
ncbi:MAG TPA: hypothetical protein VM389_10515 [Phycisphaerae bacterium]|nr:hypothetical protein [Phycisphaerae bacterium]